MIPFQNPTIYIGDLRVDEPITTITDLLFIGVCFIAFFKTKHVAHEKAANIYRWFFLLTGASTLVAALIGHAFLYHFGVESKIYGWITGIFGTCLAQFAALYHTRKTIGENVFKALLVVCYLEVIVAIILTFVVWSFVVVEVHSAFVLVLIVTILESIHYKKTKSALSLNMIYGVGIAVIAVLCHVFKLAYSVWFNHADLSHIFMALSMFMMYRGVAQFNPNKELEHG
jgi:hypothetical protein